jgi:hypothetical protein
MFFFEKKNQKTFDWLDSAYPEGLSLGLWGRNEFELVGAGA